MNEGKTARKALIFSRFAQGLTYAQIGKEFGISRQRVQQIIRPPIQVFDALRRRCGNKCERCRIPLNARDNGHVHHTDNRVDGTYHDLKKVRLLCRSCHKIEDFKKEPNKKPSKKGWQPSEETRRRMSAGQIRRWATQSEVNP